MGMLLRCTCGANLVAPPTSKTIVCGSCGRTIAIPQPDATNIGLSETVPSFSVNERRGEIAPKPNRSRSPKQLRRLVLLVMGFSMLGMAALIVVYAVMHGRGRTAASTPPDAAVAADATTIDATIAADTPVLGPDKLGTSAALVLGLRRALARADRDDLAALFDETPFAIGVDQGDIETDRAGSVDALLRALGPAPQGGFTVTSAFSRAGTGANAAWFVDDVAVTGAGRTRRFVMTYLAVERPAGWKIVALHFALSVGNKHAYELAKAELLPEPVAVPDAKAGAADLDTAFRAAFASRPALIAAFSDRPEAYNRGSAPGENSIGGPVIKREFGRMTSEIRIQDGVSVGIAAPGVGWGAANIAFTMTIDAELVTQIFRVLAICVKEPRGWKIVSLHWSNAGPIPPMPAPVTTTP